MFKSIVKEYLWDKCTGRIIVDKKLSKKKLDDLAIMTLRESIGYKDDIDNYIITKQQYISPEYENKYEVMFRYRDKRTLITSDTVVNTDE